MSTNEKVTTAAADATDTVDAEKKTDESTEAIKTEGPSSKDDAEGEADKKTEGDEEADNSNVKADESSDNKNNNKKRDAREMEPDDDDAAADGVGSSVGKRRKKTTAVFVPDNFHEKKEVETTKGRGKKLKAIPSTRKSIEEYKTTSEAFQAGYRLLFPGRGRLPLSAKDELLDFDGYLPEVDKDADQAKIDKQEEALEVRTYCCMFACLCVFTPRNDALHQSEWLTLPLVVSMKNTDEIFQESLQTHNTCSENDLWLFRYVQSSRQAEQLSAPNRTTI